MQSAELIAEVRRRDPLRFAVGAFNIALLAAMLVVAPFGSTAGSRARPDCRPWRWPRPPTPIWDWSGF